MTSKYIAYFLEEVSSWQTKLSTADSVIQIWFEVQRTWSHLESIFIGSEDIRKQLPEDSLRFDGIDSDFKELMEAAVKTPNVIEATNKKGLFALLEDIQVNCGSCQILNITQIIWLNSKFNLANHQKSNLNYRTILFA